MNRFQAIQCNRCNAGYMENHYPIAKCSICGQWFDMNDELFSESYYFAGEKTFKNRRKLAPTTEKP